MDNDFRIFMVNTDRDVAISTSTAGECITFSIGGKIYSTPVMEMFVNDGNGNIYPLSEIVKKHGREI